MCPRFVPGMNLRLNSREKLAQKNKERTNSLAEKLFNLNANLKWKLP